MAKIALFIAIMGIFYALSQSTASAQANSSGLPTANLVTNPGAEDSPGASDFNTTVAPAGWRTFSGFSAIQYAAVEDQAPISPPGGGSNYFVGGPNSSQSRAVQTIVVSTYAQQIDAGAVQAELSAYIGGWDGQDDMGSVTASFFDAAAQPLGGELDLQGPGASERGSQSVFLLRQGTGAVPKQTRSIQVAMTADRLAGNYNDADFDNLSLTLKAGVSSPAPSRARVDIKRPAGFAPSMVILQSGGTVKFCSHLGRAEILFSHSKNKKVLFHQPYYDIPLVSGRCSSFKLEKNSTGKPIVLRIRGNLLSRLHNIRREILVLTVLP